MREVCHLMYDTEEIGSEIKFQQECNPVGRVPSAAVAVSSAQRGGVCLGGGVCPGGCLPRWWVCQTPPRGKNDRQV